MRLTWRREPSMQGLARVTQGPRGAILKVNGEDVGRVYANRDYRTHRHNGWYWTARGNGVALKNTCGTPVASIEEAKAACAAYVRECLKAHESTK
jgi:hypothetical protein